MTSISTSYSKTFGNFANRQCMRHAMCPITVLGLLVLSAGCVLACRTANFLAEEPISCGRKCPKGSNDPVTDLVRS